MGRLVVSFALGLFAMTACVSALTAADEKITIQEIMENVPGKKGLVSKTVTAAKSQKWDEAAKYAKDLKKYSDALPKIAKPEKGTKESWDKLSKAFAADLAAIAAGVEKKDFAKVEAGQASFGKSCKPCHDAHKD
jgi:cytochrome c556